MLGITVDYMGDIKHVDEARLKMFRENVEYLVRKAMADGYSEEEARKLFYVRKAGE